jgi:hypothetical protein
MPQHYRVVTWKDFDFGQLVEAGVFNYDLIMAVIVGVRCNPQATAESIAAHNKLPVEDVQLYIDAYLRAGLLEERD